MLRPDELTQPAPPPELEAPSTKHGTTVVAPTTATHPTMAAFQALPPGYQVVGRLGAGHFGEVFKVRGPGGFESALKVVRMVPGEADGHKEFRSLRLIRGLKRHPNLIEYHGVWLRLPDGQFLTNAGDAADAPVVPREGMDLLILMQLGDQSLADRLRECRTGAGVPPDELLGYMLGAAKGLDHLHQPIHDFGGGQLARIIHRDIKPANLLICAGEVKVADYGVVRAEVPGQETTQTIAFTPAYAPVELYANKPEPASDLYSLAVSYYQLRTGRLPFDGEARDAHIRGRLAFALLESLHNSEVFRRNSLQDQWLSASIAHSITPLLPTTSAIVQRL